MTSGKMGVLTVRATGSQGVQQGSGKNQSFFP